ncbi:unnamed protein product [Rhodiola kirilowii]
MANILLLFITLEILLIPCSCSTIITLPLAHFLPNPSSSSPLQILNSLISTSLARSKLLKSPISTPLYTHSYGAYSTSLSLGTPPQTIPFLLQTSTDLTCLPCTHKYLCKNCTSASSITFIPKASSSSRFLPCLNPKCGWFHDTDASSRCQDCLLPDVTNCTQLCPPYIISSASGYTGGVFLTETLDLTPQQQFQQFIIGCSLFSSNEPAGVIGLGRGLASLPNQLRLSKFSYCLLSHKFDDSSKTSDLLLFLGPTNSTQKTNNLSYVHFSRNPTFPNYYYLPLRKITVGGRRVKIPYKYITTQTDGSGGTIIDSGSAFSTMAGEVFTAVSSEFVNQAAQRIIRDTELETKTGLTPCFNVSGSQAMSFPEMSFYFKGGAKMTLPLANYLSFMGESNEAVCLTLLKDDSVTAGGPSVILGNYQMQNFYAEFDLQNDRFGFKPQNC